MAWMRILRREATAQYFAQMDEKESARGEPTNSHTACQNHLVAPILRADRGRSAKVLFHPCFPERFILPCCLGCTLPVEIQSSRDIDLVLAHRACAEDDRARRRLFKQQELDGMIAAM